MVILEGVSTSQQLIQPLPDELRVLIVFDEKFLGLMSDGTLVQLKLAQRVKWLKQLLPVGIVTFQNAQRFDGRFQGAKATVGWLSTDHVAAVAGADEFDLPHTVQDSRAGVDGLGLGPRAVDEDQIERSFGQIQLLDGN